MFPSHLFNSPQSILVFIHKSPRRRHIPLFRPNTVAGDAIPHPVVASTSRRPRLSSPAHLSHSSSSPSTLVSSRRLVYAHDALNFLRKSLSCCRRRSSVDAAVVRGHAAAIDRLLVWSFRP